MTAGPEADHGRGPADAPDLVLRVVVVAALAVAAVVHVRLAPGYQQSAPGGIGAGNLFRIEAVVAVVVAIWLLWRGGRAAYAAALATGLSAVLAVLLYRYVDVPSLGPVPAMYEPVWFFQKSLSAAAEAGAAVGAALGLARAGRTKGQADAATEVK